MTKKEFQQAFAIAKDSNISLTEEFHDRNGIFHGFGLQEFQPVTVTLRQVAGLIRYQCLQFNGQWDNEALGEIRNYGRKKFIIAG